MLFCLRQSCAAAPQERARVQKDVNDPAMSMHRSLMNAKLTRRARRPALQGCVEAVCCAPDRHHDSRWVCGNATWVPLFPFYLASHYLGYVGTLAAAHA